MVELSLNFVVSLTNPGTMKLCGSIHTEGVIVLIDYGATHNFISQQIVDLLQLLVVETSNYGVIMGTGKAVKGKGVSKCGIKARLHSHFQGLPTFGDGWRRCHLRDAMTIYFGSY